MKIELPKKFDCYFQKWLILMHGRQDIVYLQFLTDFLVCVLVSLFGSSQGQDAGRVQGPVSDVH